MPDRPLTLDDFRADPRNANAGTERGPGAIARNMAANGFGRPLLAASDGTIIGGNQAKKAVGLTDMAGVDPIIIRSDGTRPIIHIREDIDPDDPRFIGLSLGDNLLSNISRSIDPDVVEVLLESIDPELIGLADVISVDDEAAAAPPATVSATTEQADQPGDADGAGDPGQPGDAAPAAHGEGKRLAPVHQIVVTCDGPAQQREVFDLLSEMGLNAVVRTL